MKLKAQNMLRSGDWSIVEKNRRAGLRMVCEGDIGTLGSIHLDVPSLAPALDTGEVILNGYW